MGKCAKHQGRGRPPKECSDCSDTPRVTLPTRNIAKCPAHQGRGRPPKNCKECHPNADLSEVVEKPQPIRKKCERHQGRGRPPRNCRECNGGYEDTEAEENTTLTTEAPEAGENTPEEKPLPKVCNTPIEVGDTVVRPMLECLTWDTALRMATPCEVISINGYEVVVSRHGEHLKTDGRMLVKLEKPRRRPTKVKNPQPVASA